MWDRGDRKEKVMHRSDSHAKNIRFVVSKIL